MKYITPVIAGLALMLSLTAFLKSQQGQTVTIATPQTEISAPIQLLPEGDSPLLNESEPLSAELTDVLLKVEQQLQLQAHELEALRSELETLKQITPPATDAEREYAELMRDLPPDFEQRLKTDPEYADQMQRDLLDKVADSSLHEDERLRAIQQLMMVSGSVGAFNQVQDNARLNQAITQLVDNASQESTRIKALEHLSFLGATDARHRERFLDLIENDDNRYVRNLASDALSSMLYSADLTYNQRSGLVQKISNLMNNGDSTTRELLAERFGTPEQLRQFEQQINEEALDLPQ